MNDFEKKALDMLTEDEREKVAGGANIYKQEHITDNQCGELKRIIKEKYTPIINPADLVLCKYGGPGMFKPNVNVLYKHKLGDNSTIETDAE